MPLSEIEPGIIDTGLACTTRQFMKILGAEEKNPAEFLTTIPQGLVRLVRVDPGRGRVARLFVCADVKAGKFFSGENHLTYREFYWIPLQKLPADIVSRVEALENA